MNYSHTAHTVYIKLNNGGKGHDRFRISGDAGNTETVTG